MEIPENIANYLKQVIISVKKTMPVTAIYIFGSYATGKFNENSDVDIYILTSDKTKRSIKTKLEIVNAIGDENYISTDFVIGFEDDFERRNKIKNTIEYEVKKKGVTIYANE